MDMGLVGSMNPAPDLERQRRRIGEELARAGRPDWPITVVAGSPAGQIAETARKLGATLIVMGIGRHAPIDRLMGSETALEVIQLTDIPVLAVARGLGSVPARALAAVDFTTQSETAARVAAELLTDDGTLLLAHVRSDWVESIDPLIPVDIYAAGVERKFDEMERRLAVGHVAPPVVERGTGSGDVAPELLRIAADRTVDLIAVGAHAHSRLERLFLGSVAAKLLRGAHCSVLVIPARAEAIRSASRQRAVGGRTMRGKT
jgi:nucleotide-binding universal stress UspA family protein